MQIGRIRNEYPTVENKVLSILNGQYFSRSNVNAGVPQAYIIDHLMF